MIDSDGSGVMDFSEYISILITYCIFNQEDILRFAFSCFDGDASGYIDSEEINRLITMVNNVRDIHPLMFLCSSNHKKKLSVFFFVHILYL